MLQIIDIMVYYFTNFYILDLFEEKNIPLIVYEKRIDIMRPMNLTLTVYNARQCDIFNNLFTQLLPVQYFHRHIYTSSDMSFE